MNMNGTSLPPGLRRTETDWGLILAPGERAAVEPRAARLRRRIAGAASLLLAGLALGLSLGLEAAGWAGPLAAVSFGAMGAIMLWPRRAEVRIEIEVDLRHGELRVVESQDGVRTTVSREPMGSVGAIEVGRTVVSFPKPVSSSGLGELPQSGGEPATGEDDRLRSLP